MDEILHVDLRDESRYIPKVVLPSCWYVINKLSTVINFRELGNGDV